MLGQTLEAIMLICFGLSWPMNAYKSYQARTAAGSSWQFILLITLGYLAGIAAKYAANQINWVLIVYYLNLVFIAINWVVYFRNTRLDRSRLQNSKDTKMSFSSPHPLKRILVASDGSQASLDAVQFALDSMDLSQAHVQIINAVGTDSPQALEAARQRTLKTANMLSQAKISCSINLRHGRAAEQIVSEASESDAELVVMGSRGLSGIQRAALGSVSRDVVERCEKPVLVVK